MSPRALIFDLDGTVADTEEMHRRAFNAAFIRLELWWDWAPERYASLLSISGGLDRLHHYVESLTTGTAEKARLHAIVPIIHFTKSEIYGELLRAGRPPLRPGVARLITEAWHEGLDVAVVSTTGSANALELLRHHFKHGEIELLVCADEVERRKPAPDIYRRALALLHRPAEDCIAFEDSANGVRAARAAGLAVVAAPSRWTMGQDFDGAHRVVHDLSELNAWT